MSNATKTNLKLEILLSTKNRNSLDFLAKLFPNGNYQDYNLLIINQTTEDCLLESKYTNIRVVNSYAKGLTNSRNLALEHARESICLIADDDVIYYSNFEKNIIKSFENNREADIITYKMKDLEGRDFKIYSQSEWHDVNSLKQVNSVVVAFKFKSIRDRKISFNPHFGLSSTFETADEYIFLRDCLKADLKLWFESNYILSHDFNSSGRDSGSDRLVFARAALYYKYSGFLGYLKLYKYLYLIYRDNYINTQQILPKLKTGLRGISTYKKLLKTGKETR